MTCLSHIGCGLALGVVAASGASLSPLVTTERLGFPRLQMPVGAGSDADTITGLTLVSAPSLTRVLADGFRIICGNRWLTNQYGGDQKSWGENPNNVPVTVRMSMSYVPSTANSGNGWAGVVTYPIPWGNSIFFCDDGTGLPTIATLAEFQAAGGVISGDNLSITYPLGWLSACDPILWSNVGRTYANANGRQFWFKTESTVPAVGNTIPNNMWGLAGTNEATFGFGSGGAGNQVFDPVPLVGTGNTSSNVGYLAPIAVVGDWGANGALPTLASFGMSITQGSSAQGTANNSDISTSGTYMAQSFKGAYTKPTYGGSIQHPYCRGDLGSREARSLVGDKTMSALIARYVDEIFIDLATNSLAQSNTIPTIAGYFSAATEAFKFFGTNKVHWHQTTPRATSSNSFVDAAGQTPTFNFTPGGLRDQWNAALPGLVGTANGPDSFIDSTTYVQDPIEPNKWITTGAANYATNDALGIHPTLAGTTLMKGVIGDGNANSLRQRILEAVAH